LGAGDEEVKEFILAISVEIVFDSYFDRFEWIT
jgi:hypothetical protein